MQKKLLHKALHLAQVILLRARKNPREQLNRKVNKLVQVAPVVVGLPVPVQVKTLAKNRVIMAAQNQIRKLAQKNNNWKILRKIC